MGSTLQRPFFSAAPDSAMEEALMSAEPCISLHDLAPCSQPGSSSPSAIQAGKREGSHHFVYLQRQGLEAVPHLAEEEAPPLAESSISGDDCLECSSLRRSSNSPGSSTSQVEKQDDHFVHRQRHVFEAFPHPAMDEASSLAEPSTSLDDHVVCSPRGRSSPSQGSPASRVGKHDDQRHDLEAFLHHAMEKASSLADPLVSRDDHVLCSQRESSSPSHGGSAIQVGKQDSSFVHLQPHDLEVDEKLREEEAGTSSCKSPLLDDRLPHWWHDLQDKSALPLGESSGYGCTGKEGVGSSLPLSADDLVHLMDLMSDDLEEESAKDQAGARKEEGCNMSNLPCSSPSPSSPQVPCEQQQQCSLSRSSASDTEDPEPFAMKEPSNISEPSSGHPSNDTDVAVASPIAQRPDCVSNTKYISKEKLMAKVVKQVEFYFSDANLPTDDYLLKFVKRDPAGFVPIPVIASFTKVRMLVKDYALIATALKSSSHLVLSDDCKKVRRLHPLPDIDFEETQLSRTVIAENLPMDHSMPAMEKLFGSIGNVKMIRICKPEGSYGTNQTRSKFPRADKFVSNKVHALVEYESIELAERAVAELTDERNWRSGLHVRLLQRRMFQNKYGYQKHSGMKGQRMSSDTGDNSGGEDDIQIMADESYEKSGEQVFHDSDKMEDVMGSDSYRTNEKDGLRRGRGRGRGRGFGRPVNGGRGHSSGIYSYSSQVASVEMKLPPGPRMPDGTKGFTIGRGKNLPTSTST